MSNERADKQTTGHPSSHSEDEVSEGGWSGYPSDSQTTPKKLHVRRSDDRDQALKVLESEASGPVSSRTRSSEWRADEDHGANRCNDRNSADDTKPDGHRGATGRCDIWAHDGDATVECVSLGVFVFSRKVIAVRLSEFTVSAVIHHGWLRICDNYVVASLLRRRRGVFCASDDGRA